MSGVQSLILPTLIRIKQRVVGWSRSVFASVCTTLLCCLSLDCLYVY